MPGYHFMSNEILWKWVIDSLSNLINLDSYCLCLMLYDIAGFFPQGLWSGRHLNRRMENFNLMWLTGCLMGLSQWQHISHAFIGITCADGNSQGSQKSPHSHWPILSAMQMKRVIWHSIITVSGRKTLLFVSRNVESHEQEVTGHI